MEPLTVNCSKGLTYKEAGVDIDAGSELVKRIAKMAPGIGGFGGHFPLGIVLISSLSLSFEIEGLMVFGLLLASDLIIGKLGL